ncbi:MAG TPA: allophanate hydrolase subunit 1 [Elusimicrobiales bacterium]|nr:allophanate hydrolase subunit 1 [Elusimicrobiales bacterium]
MAPAKKPYKTCFLGDACLLWSIGGTIALPTSRKLLFVYRKLKEDERLRALGVRDLVPSYTSLAVHADALSDWAAIRRMVDRCFDSLPGAAAELGPAGLRHVLPVSYRGEDLPRVAKFTGLTQEEIIRRHTAPEYMVAMIGFRPHFPYLIGLDPRLATPRLDSPRVKVPAGAVGIGGEQTGVYPEESPGGWNLLGTTDAGLLTTVRPGDTIIFKRLPA